MRSKRAGIPGCSRRPRARGTDPCWAAFTRTCFAFVPASSAEGGLAGAVDLRCGPSPWRWLPHRFPPHADVLERVRALVFRQGLGNANGTVRAQEVMKLVINRFGSIGMKLIG